MNITIRHPLDARRQRELPCWSHITALAFALAVLLANVRPLFATEIPTDATVRRDLSSAGVRVHQMGNTLWLQVLSPAVDRKQFEIPRLCAPIRALHWDGAPAAALKFVPEPGEWVFSWKEQPAGVSAVVVEFDSPPTRPGESEAVRPAGDGSILLSACHTTTVGEKLRFEPQPHKNTVGYWTVASDYAMWDVVFEQPGTYSVAILQGCGAGQGGSDALLTVRSGNAVAASLPFQTLDTGHFQNFRWNHLGCVEIADRGASQLRIEAVRIAKVALCDIRAVHLVRQAQPLPGTN